MDAGVSVLTNLLGIVAAGPSDLRFTPAATLFATGRYAAFDCACGFAVAEAAVDGRGALAAAFGAEFAGFPPIEDRREEKDCR